MLRLKVFEMLEKRRQSAYWLAEATGLGRTAYRYAKKDAIVERIEARNLGLLCEALRCQPGDLLEWIPRRGR